MPGWARTTPSSRRSKGACASRTTARGAASSAFCHSSKLFVDEVDVHVEAGNGGRGCLAFRREKFVPRGGPSGGDGGHGGAGFILARPPTNNPINYPVHPPFQAERGGHRLGSKFTGHRGARHPLPLPTRTP